MSPNFAAPIPHAYANGGTGDAADLASVDSKAHLNLAASSLNSYPTEGAMSSTAGHQTLNGSLPGDQTPKALPKIGETRCYWTLLSAGLDFIYLDPVLQSHLEDQSGLLVGKSLLDFVHPDERASAEHDLGSVLESKTLHGSVTRVRYCRLSRIRYDLGHRTAQSPWHDADKIALDASYMAVDIVINWAADGLVLCFIHAVTDLTPNDNDEKHKSQWSNWCGTPYMAMQQIELLYQRLLVCIPQTNSPSRVFQILNNADQKSLLMTWPPDQGQGRDYQKLVEAVNIRSGESGEDDAKTSCTRRYKAMQSMPLGEVESIIIPHGTIVFACHKLNQQYFDQGSNGYAAPPYPQSAPPYGGSGYNPQQAQYPQQWAEDSDQGLQIPPQNDMRPASYPSQAHWGTQPYMDPSSAFPPRAASPEFYSVPAGGNDDSSANEVPPPRRRVSPSLSGSTRESASTSARSAGNRPIGIQKCTSCKTTSSPEWRKGPSGKKELCNACGLRFARSRAKKEGTTLSAAHRKRKDKNLSVKTHRGSAPPSPINGGPQSGSRRAFDDSQGSQGSGSGSQGDYAAPMEGVSRSPSPDGGAAANFVHYSHPSGAHHRNPQPQALHTDTRSNPYSNATNSFYSAPSPLSNSNVHQSHGNLSHSNSQSQMSAIRGTDSPYDSPLASTTAVPASFERGGGERGSKLPPAQPVSESRMASAHSMLMLQH